MEYRILGPLEVQRDQRVIPLGRGLGCSVLAALVLHADRVVTPEVLADAVWYGAEPASWRKSLQMHIGRLRTALGPDAIETVPGGYRIPAGRSTVDGHLFVAALQQPAPGRDAAIDDVLAMWRGRPYDELGEWPAAVAARRLLTGLYADAVEERMRSKVRRDIASIAELEQFVEDAPDREHRWSLLMLALYRNGRQAEALRAFERARARLAEHFGIDPGVNLIALQRAILDQDPRLFAREFDVTALAAADGSDIPRAIVEHRSRAEEYGARGEPAAAQHELEAALVVARQTESDPRVVIDLQLELAEVARRAGDPRRAVEGAKAAADLARVIGEPSRLARAALILSGDGLLTGLDPEADPVVLLDEALSQLRAAPSPLRAKLLARRAVAVSHNRPLELAEADATEALALARVLGDAEVLAMALHARLVVDQDLMHLESREAIAQELADLAEVHDKPKWWAWAAPAQARMHALRGDFASACAVLDALETSARAAHDPVGVYHAASRHVLTTTTAGDFDGAERALADVRDAGVHALMDPTAPTLAYLGARGILRLLRGVPAEGTFADEIVFPQETMHAAFLASLALSAVFTDDLVRAREVIAPLTPERLSTLPCDLYWPTVVWLVAATCQALNDGDRAAALRPRAAAIADLYVVDPGGMFLGAMHHHAGLLAAATGDLDAARFHLRNAVTAHRCVGAVWLERSEHELRAVETENILQ